MKGFIFNIQRFSTHDGPGIRTTVFFKGCPLHCIWCHNPEGINSEPEKCTKKLRLGSKILYETAETGYYMTVSEIIAEVMNDRIFYEESGGGVTFSGGEPLMQPDFLLLLGQKLRQLSVHTTLDTCGYSEADILRKAITPFDLILYDIKHLDDREHIKYTGVSNRSILRNLDHILLSGKKVIIRFPFIPGINDTPEQIDRFNQFILERKDKISALHILPYHKMGDGKYQRFSTKGKPPEWRILKKEEYEKIIKLFACGGVDVKIGG